MKPPLNARRLYTPGEVAKLFHVTATTVTRWDEEGKLRAALRTPGGSRRFDADEVDALLAVQDFGAVLDGEAIE
jgi:excisionase family DNA binding protein